MEFDTICGPMGALDVSCQFRANMDAGPSMNVCCKELCVYYENMTLDVQHGFI